MVEWEEFLDLEMEGDNFLLQYNTIMRSSDLILTWRGIIVLDRRDVYIFMRTKIPKGNRSDNWIMRWKRIIGWSGGQTWILRWNDIMI